MKAHRRLIRLGPDVRRLLAAQEAAPPEARVVQRLQEVAALQDRGDDTVTKILIGHLDKRNIFTGLLIG